MNNELSKKYGFLTLYQVLLLISILVYSWFTYKGIIILLDLKKTMPGGKENFNEMITISVMQYLLILFSTICIISIVNFIFSLNENINDLDKKQGQSKINKKNKIISQNEENSLNEKEQIEKTKLKKTILEKNINENSIIQGRIYKILGNTIIVAHNDNKDSLIEVKNYPTENIIDEVWVKISVRYLYTTSNLVDVVAFVTTAERF